MRWIGLFITVILILKFFPTKRRKVERLLRRARHTFCAQQFDEAHVLCLKAIDAAKLLSEPNRTRFIWQGHILAVRFDYAAGRLTEAANYLDETLGHSDPKSRDEYDG